MTDSTCTELLEMWGISFGGVVPEICIEGSPARTAARTVVRDTGGGHWILEQIEPGNLARKKQIASQLMILSHSGLNRIHPWRRTKSASFFQGLEKKEGAGSACWMLRPFVEGVPLDRTAYLNDSWRMDALADFLVTFRKHTSGLSGPDFSITSYAENRMVAWRKRYSELAQKLEPSFHQLKRSFFPVHGHLPVAFCHGDYHPLNMVWGEGDIRSVIDWEFCGSKPELYDVALLLGCIGFDDPDYLLKKPVVRLVKTLRGAGFGAPLSWEYLLELMATIRYGWMSEWLRRSDREACSMEAIYIDILVDQKEYILKHW